jgi:hypothetical protein
VCEFEEEEKTKEKKKNGRSAISQANSFSRLFFFLSCA